MERVSKNTVAGRSEARSTLVSIVERRAAAVWHVSDHYCRRLALVALRSAPSLNSVPGE